MAPIENYISGDELIINGVDDVRSGHRKILKNKAAAAFFLSTRVFRGTPPPLIGTQWKGIFFVPEDHHLLPDVCGCQALPRSIWLIGREEGAKLK